jgi:CheY-like chemotaxis protein
LIATRNEYVDRPIQGYTDVQEGDYVVLAVSDSGNGIAPEDLGRIFEPFYTKKIMGRSGTGLGMAVVWGTVQDHHGYIQVESGTGIGSTFTLFFPVCREDTVKPRPATPIDSYLGNREKILIIDDIEEQRLIAGRLLSRLGYEVAAVASGEEAIAHIRHNPVDLLLLDMIMEPGMDGLDTYREILKVAPGQKAVIASGFAENDRVREAQRLGAGDYIRKPYTIEVLGLAISKQLRRRDQRQAGTDP